MYIVQCRKVYKQPFVDYITMETKLTKEEIWEKENEEINNREHGEIGNN